MYIYIHIRTCMRWRTWRQLCTGRQEIMRQNDTKWKGKIKHHRQWLLPCRRCSPDRGFFFALIIFLSVHLLSQALVRQCSDWIACFSAACCSSCWYFPLPVVLERVVKKEDRQRVIQENKMHQLCLWVSQRAISISYMPHPGFHSLRYFCCSYY